VAKPGDVGGPVLRSAPALVATGLAVTVLPGLLCAEPPDGVAILPLPDKGRTVEVVVRSGSDGHPAVAAALDVPAGRSIALRSDGGRW
jgi:DNA-binding transcriptional LysR family regulator